MVETFNAYKAQRNRCVNILRKTKCDYYKSLDLKDFTDSQKFRKTVKLVFTETIQVCQAIKNICTKGHNTQS